MDITNENFISLLPEICETIQDCDFIAIDTELSGLLRERAKNRLENPEERFLKCLKSSRGYFIMQFGLSCFTKIDNSRYSNRTYNIYIFPQPHKVYGDIDRTLSIQAHAIQFLSEHNFDFNKLFKHGVSYITFAEKKLIGAQVKLEMKNRPKTEFCREEQKSALVSAKGFLEIIETIILNKKPLVGHNLLLDLIQIINQFIEQLADDYDSFKETCRSLFPLIYDTKYIAHSILDPDTLLQNQSRLNDLYNQLRVNDSFPRIQIDHLGVFFDENQLPHQAGYDAYMSGFCFIALCEAYLQERCKHNKDGDSSDSQTTKPIAKSSEIVHHFSNRIYLSYCQDFNCYNLAT